MLLLRVVFGKRLDVVSALLPSVAGGPLAKTIRGHVDSVRERLEKKGVKNAKARRARKAAPEAARETPKTPLLQPVEPVESATFTSTATTPGEKRAADRMKEDVETMLLEALDDP